MSILRHLLTRIRESILSISLSSRLSRAIGQSPYQSRVLAVISRCVYRPSVVQLLIWVFVYIYLVAFYLSLYCSHVSLRVYSFLLYWRSRCDFFDLFYLWLSDRIPLYSIIFITASFLPEKQQIDQKIRAIILTLKIAPNITKVIICFNISDRNYLSRFRSRLWPVRYINKI